MFKDLHHSFEQIPHWVMYSVGGMAIAGTVAYAGVGWYLSSQLLRPNNQTVTYDQVVQGVNGNTIQTEGSAYSIDGRVGLINDHSKFVGELGPPHDSNRQLQISSRTFLETPNATITAGDHVSLQGNIWTSDPERALGLPFENVKYHAPLGDMSAWVIPGTQPEKWTVAVHGIGAPKGELLRFVKPVHDSGNTMMVINYRNDPGNPRSPDGFTHLGDTEWQDVQAAVVYARKQGATVINLYGVSLGGSLVQNYLRRAPVNETADINKVVLDSPALDWKQLLRHRVEQRGYPGWFAQPGFIVASLRSGINFSRISTHPGSITHQTLLIHSSDDPTVPNSPSKQIAAAQPKLVELVDFGRGGHIRSWNYAPRRYEELVRDFLG
jgi:pimeloyl-ACP methyl ester carboxylesterase